MQGKTDSEVLDCLDILSVNEKNFPQEYLNTEVAKKVVEKYGEPLPSKVKNPSVGIPTFAYSNEPSNFFSHSVCKFFSRATRQDVLAEVSKLALIFPGSVGTRHEVFDIACRNADEPEKAIPIVFYDHEGFWSKGGIWDILSPSSNEPKLCSESQEKVHEFIQLNFK